MPNFSKLENKSQKLSEKTFLRYMFMEGFAKFLVIFVQRYFYPLKNTISNQKFDDLNRFRVKFAS